MDSAGFVAAPGITRHHHTLADGRDLIYFDDPDTRLSPERAADTRQLDPRPPTASMRQDPLSGEWVSIASARQNRVFLPPANLDPLAPSTPENPSEVPSNYDVAVFENKSPSFGPLLTDANAPAGLAELSEIGLGRTRTSVGRCEVVCFSPENEGSFASLSVTRARTVIEAWAERTHVLSQLPGIQQVFPFENRGEAIGVTLRHPHGQIYSYPYVTPRTQRVIASLETYGPTLFADVLASEQAADRVIIRGEHWTAFVPFAARWPIEVHMLPHRQIPDFAATSLAERDELAVLYRRLLRGIDAIYSTPTPYIAAWHQAPVHTHRDDIRLMLQVTSPRRAEDKLKYLAGSEAAMGAWIGDVTPEQAAAGIRAAVERSMAADAASEARA
ncbi:MULTISPECIES: galactose-1-phosphate uridylyltransferase [Cryobacterium]|uniref:Galactose-1-phosphate uridylyltransferase n=1 Tax=Cryobacterium glucosi TaxID=1259175 RepID=A0ABY2ILY8_9MICO|nr:MULTISPECIES: galactose-1-phosphate uridylyltransferase [Cryobacterium]MDY7528978.1 galactose-1-phosphate uridylyltransferase [Cryobacterium sp. 10C2]MDY7558855.1 galactose-1-phosphate uridylyltransferase [Cryobacterium sp. 10C3]MEB0003186.1 galactose-1-phosphate uridylyltransferase [Cryobacterium sp. RTC2.1]MEB0200786.1 galactose-1-phosphate uridylyltransferase [Cryobacterium sp. 5I3]MEB0285623.1 galactose-1-phosphate uridylyltransferase [Cryobacterium sp. 10S3]